MSKLSKCLEQIAQVKQTCGELELKSARVSGWVSLNGAIILTGVTDPLTPTQLSLTRSEAKLVKEWLEGLLDD